MTDIAMQPLEVAPHRWNTVRLAIVAFAVAALIAASFAIGRVTSTSQSSSNNQSSTTSSTTNSGTSVSVPADAPALHGVQQIQQPALVCHLHGPC
jgi:hypothetical protein